MTGAGGRMVDAGTGCVATLINNGYAAGTATRAACAAKISFRAPSCA